MIICDLCGEAKDCLQKEIEGCECWNPLAQKLRGKGRAINREIVLLPPPRAVEEHKDEEPAPLPGEPPKIWGAMEMPHYDRLCGKQNVSPVTIQELARALKVRAQNCFAVLAKQHSEA